jgi:hypothetical protein
MGRALPALGQVSVWRLQWRSRTSLVPLFPAVLNLFVWHRMTMFKIAKVAVKASPLWPFIRARRRERAVEVWLETGRPAPPPHAVKVRNLLAFADIFDINTLVETGTFRGDMIDATKHRFSALYSVEVFPPLVKAARARFAAFPHVSILEGTSDQVLKTLLPNIVGPTLFWLDAHYHGKGTGQGDSETPIIQELAILASRNERDVIAIDDLRLFGSNPAYPSSAHLKEAAARDFPRHILLEMCDALFLLPRLEQ